MRYPDDEQIQKWADEAERGYVVDDLIISRDLDLEVIPSRWPWYDSPWSLYQWPPRWPIYFGGDEYMRKTLVLELPLCGRLVIPISKPRKVDDV